MVDPEIEERGGGGVLFLRSEDFFEAPSHLPYAFVVRV